MTKINPFSRLVTRLLHMGNFDHADLTKIDIMGKKLGLTQLESRQAYFVARDKHTLIESEMMDGGTGSVAKRTRNNQILTATFSAGESKG